MTPKQSYKQTYRAARLKQLNKPWFDMNQMERFCYNSVASRIVPICTNEYRIRIRKSFLNDNDSVKTCKLYIEFVRKNGRAWWQC